MNDLSNTPCRNQGPLFASTDLNDHELARNICITQCNSIGACAQLLRQVQEDTAGVRNSGGGPVGTWAGKLFGKKGYRPGYVIPDCGTDRGYYRHRGQKERACDECRAAHAAAGRKKAAS